MRALPTTLVLLAACSDNGLTKHNATPDAQILSPVVGEALTEGRTLLLRGAASDPDDVPTELSTRWFVDDVEVCPSAAPDADGTVDCATAVPAARFRVDLEVRDPAGAGAVASIALDVLDDLPPTASITAPRASEVLYADEPVLLEGVVADAEDDPASLSVRWISSRDGELVATSTVDADGAVRGYGALTVGSHALQLVVTDSLGQQGSADVLVTVEDHRNTAPSLRLLEPTAGSVTNEGDAVAFVAEVEDAEDAPERLWVSWVSDLDGVLVEATADASGRSAFALDDLSVGTHLVAVTVEDTEGASATELVEIRVNGLPSAPVITLSPAAPGTGDDLVAALAVASVDADGDAVTYTWAWSVDGAPSAASTAETLPASATTRGERWTVEVTPADAWGSGPSGTASAVVGNTAPSLASVAITPNPAYASATLTCTATGWSDADGDADASTFTWTVDGVAAGTGTSLAGAFAAGQTVTCEATPFDGTDAGAPVSDLVVIQNTPPEVTSLSLSPSAPDTDDTVSANVSVVDAEGDAVTLAYAWTVNGVAAGTGSTLSGSLFVKHDVIALTVTPSDASGTGASASATATVVNSPPSAPGVAFDPSDPEEGEALRCEVTSAASDLDGDTVSYTMAWTVDGAAYPAGGDVGPTTAVWPDDEASAADTQAGERFTCTVTPNDGEDDGATASVSVDIDDAITRVFVSSTGLNGGFGALANADAHCQDAADAASLGGTWVAWISNSGTSARDRIPDGPYVRLDGVEVASSKADLVDGSLAAPINVDENGNGYSSWVLTGTSSTGSASYSGSTVNGLCADWTNGCGVCYGNHYYMTVGRSYETDRDWTDTGWLFCSSSPGVYCFEE